jgi:neutral ceramidase
VRTGFGAATITPSVPPIWLAGFGARTEPANALRDDLEARAIYLDDGTTALCLIVCDLLGMSPGYSTPARAAIAEEFGIPIGCVLTACTHTHSGPSAMAGTEALGWPNPHEYGDILREGCLAAARHAREAAEDAELRYARAPLPSGVSFNRRGLPYDGPEFAVLDAVRPDGHRLGALANIAVHPVALGPDNLAISTDWVGPFRTELERLAGGFAIELTGALGDVNPLPPSGKLSDDGNTYAPWATPEETDQIGRTLAEATASALDECETIATRLEVVRAETIDLPVGGTGLAAMIQAESMAVDFVEWAIGDIRLVSIPGEAFFELGREIEDARNRRCLLAGISPSWHGYLPVPWGDGYEEGVSYGRDFVQAVRAKLFHAP